jgi:hypothetical protein
VKISVLHSSDGRSLEFLDSQELTLAGNEKAARNLSIAGGLCCLGNDVDLAAD